MVRPSFLKFAGLSLAAAVLFAIAPFAGAQTAEIHGSTTNRAVVPAQIDETTLVSVGGAVDKRANARTDRGIVEDSLPMEHIQLGLLRAPEVQKSFDTAVEQLHVSGSGSYHKWLTPEQIGESYGPAQADVAKLRDWLEKKGFKVNFVMTSGMVIDFTGDAGMIKDAFHTEIHNLELPNGEKHVGAISQPQIPAAFQQLVAGFPSLSDFRPKPMNVKKGTFKYDPTAKKVTGASPENVATPDFTFCPTGGTCSTTAQTGYSLAVGATDFYTIYNETPLLATTTGSGQTVAVLEESDINTTDVTTFRTAFGVTPNTPSLTVAHGTTTVTCTDPGKLDTSADPEESEADIDAEWAGVAAPGATILFESCASTSSTAGILLSSEAVVDGNLAGSASLSYGIAEPLLTGTGSFSTYGANALWNLLWEQAAAQGITVSVSSGDSGVALESDLLGENLGGLAMATASPQTVNGLGSTPWNISAGGTDFQDEFDYILSGSTGNWISNYWNLTANTAAPFSSAKSYVPEMTWNSTCASPIFVAELAYYSYVGSVNPYTNCNEGLTYYEAHSSNVYAVQLNGGGGGLSSIYATPSWQSGVYGTSVATKRALPDISLFSSSGFWGHFLMYCDSDPYGGDGATAIPCSYTSTTDASFQGAGGTSFVAPQIAGIMALVEQKTGERQGQANYVLYKLAGTEYGSTTATGACLATGTTSNAAVDAGAAYLPSTGCTFYDITEGSIDQPCYWKKNNTVEDATCFSSTTDAYGTYYVGAMSPVNTSFTTTYSAAEGYDLATGLGSVNITNLVNGWAAGASFTATVTLADASLSGKSWTYGNPVASSNLVTTVTGTGSLPTGGITDSVAPTVGTVGTGTFPATGCSTLTGTGTGTGACQSSNTVTVAYAPAATLAPNAYTLSSTYSTVNENYTTGANATLAFTVNKQTPTTALTAPANGAINQPYGSPAPFNATATLTWTGAGNAPTAANVVFVTNAAGTWGTTTCTATSPATCTGTFTPTVNPVGSYYVQVNFTGDINYIATATAQNASAYTVVAAATTVSAVTITPSTIYVGQTGTVSATLTWAGTGTAPGSGNSILAFSASNNSVPAASATFSGETCTVGTNTLTCTATLTPAASDTTGTLYTVTALYATTTNYTTNSNTGTWTYGAPTQVMTKPTSTLNPSTYNSSVTFTTTRTYTAGANAPTGTVSILVYIGSTLTYTLPATCGAGNPQTCTATDAILPVNTYNVYGYAAADSTDGYATARSLNALSQVVNQQTPTVTETATSEPYGTAIPLTSTVTFVSDSDGAVAATGTVTFTVSSGGTAVGTASCTLASATATTSTCSTTYPAGLAGGAYTVVAAYGGDTDYGTASSGSSGFNVTPVTSSLTLAAATAGTTTAGTTSSLLTATLSPAVSGVTITFTDATNGTTLGTGMTNASGVATLTVTTATTGVSAGLNNMTATATATASVGTSTSTAVPVYLQGILQATSLNHNFTAYTVGETGVDGTTDGSPICNGSNGVNGQTCTTGYSVAVTNFTSSTQVITATLGTLADKAFTYATNCPAAGLAAYAKCQFVFYYLPPYGDGCTPNSNCTTGGTSPNTYQQGTFEETTWSVGTSGVLKGLYFSGTTGGGAPLSPVVLEGKAILATGNYLSVTPTSLSFGPQAPNSVSATQDITVTNGSSGALAGITYSVASGTATNSHFTTNNQCSATLAAGASCQIQVSYSDTTVESSSLTLTITPPSPEVALTVSLTGSTVTTTNTLSLNTTTHNFGNVTDGSTVTFGLGLTNNSATIASTPSFSYSQANGFTFDTSTCPASLAPGATCQVNVSFTPSSAGSYSQILTIHDNLEILPNGTTSAPYSDTVTFNGNGVAGGTLTATSTGHDFGTTAVGSEATAYGVELSNNTGTTVTLATGGGTFASNGAADGYTYATNCGTTMAANTNCEYVFYFTPQSVGQTQVFFPLSGGSSYPLNGSVTGITLTGTGQ